MGEEITNARILVADDDELVRQLVAFKLRAEGFDVIESADGDHVLDLLAAGDIDLVILDGMLPGKDGFYILQEVKENNLTKDIPVVFLTARSRDEDVVKGLSLGADEYIVKPFIPDELVIRIRRQLSERPSDT